MIEYVYLPLGMYKYKFLEKGMAMLAILTSTYREGIITGHNHVIRLTFRICLVKFK